MAYLHEQSPAVVHFDLKPDNLLVDGEGDSMVIKVRVFMRMRTTTARLVV
jgi:serine/threonine protein kinase